MELLLLPPELIDSIIDFAVEDQSRHDALNIPLVCRAFVRRFQSHLFAYLTLNGPEDCAKWISRHASSPHLGEYVRHIGITNFKRPIKRPVIDTSGWSDLSELLLTCPKTISAAISNLDLDYIPGVKEWYRTLPSIRILSLSSCRCSYISFSSFVWLLPALKELRLIQLDITSLYDEHPPRNSGLSHLFVSPGVMPPPDRTRLAELLGSSVPYLASLSVDAAFDEDHSLTGNLVQRTSKSLESLRLKNTMMFHLPTSSPLATSLVFLPNLRKLHVATILINVDSPDDSDVRLIDHLNSPNLQDVLIRYRFLTAPLLQNSRWMALDQTLSSERRPNLERVTLVLHNTTEHSAAESMLRSFLPSLDGSGMLVIKPSSAGLGA